MLMGTMLAAPGAPGGSPPSPPGGVNGSSGFLSSAMVYLASKAGQFVHTASKTGSPYAGAGMSLNSCIYKKLYTGRVQIIIAQKSEASELRKNLCNTEEMRKRRD